MTLRLPLIFQSLFLPFFSAEIEFRKPLLFGFSSIVREWKNRENPLSVLTKKKCHLEKQGKLFLHCLKYGMEETHCKKMSFFCPKIRDRKIWGKIRVILKSQFWRENSNYLEIQFHHFGAKIQTNQIFNFHYVGAKFQS